MTSPAAYSTCFLEIPDDSRNAWASNGDLLWEGEESAVSFNADGSFSWDGAAAPVQPPYEITRIEADDGR